MKLDAKQAVIPFERPEAKTLETVQCHVYKLWTSPTNADSPVYKLTVLFFESRSLEQGIKFWKNLEAVLKGQNVTSGPAKYAVFKSLLKGDALTIFKAAKTSYGSVTLVNFEKCLDNVTTHVFPEKSV